MQRIAAAAARKVQMQHAKSIKFPKQNELQKRQEGRRNCRRREERKVKEKEEAQKQTRAGREERKDAQETVKNERLFFCCVCGGKLMAEFIICQYVELTMQRKR